MRYTVNSTIKQHFGTWVVHFWNLSHPVSKSSNVCVGEQC